MKKFALCVKKSGEIINTHLAKTIEEAINYFSTVKKIDDFNLLDIYDVKKID